MTVAKNSDQDPSFLKSELAVIIQLSSPVLLVVSLMFLIVVCTLIMLCTRLGHSGYSANGTFLFELVHNTLSSDRKET